MKWILITLFLIEFAIDTSVAVAAGADVKVRKLEKSVVMQINPPKGTHLNFDGPWKLEILGAVPLANRSGVYGLESFDKSSRTFALELTREIRGNEASTYNLVYFICADNNSWCKRSETKGIL